MAYCIKCGIQLPTGSNFCKLCGQNQSLSVTAADTVDKVRIPIKQSHFQLETYTHGRFNKYGRYLLLCALGGLAAWIVCIIFNVNVDTVLGWMGHPSTDVYLRELREQMLYTMAESLAALCPARMISWAIFSSLFSGSMGYFISIAEFKQRYPLENAPRKSLLFLTISFAIGAVTGCVCQLISCQISSHLVISNSQIIYYRLSFYAFNWGFLGMGITLSVSLIDKTCRHILRYTLTGLLSGAIVGIIYCLIVTPISMTDAYEQAALMDTRADDILIKFIIFLIFALIIGGTILFFNKAKKDKAKDNRA